MLTRDTFSHRHFHAPRTMVVVLLLIWIGSAMCSDLSDLSESNRITCDRIPKTFGEGWVAFAVEEGKIDVYAQQNRSIQLRCDGTVAPGNSAAFDQICTWGTDVRNRQRKSFESYHPTHTGKPLCSLTISTFDGGDTGEFVCFNSPVRGLVKSWTFSTKLAVPPGFDQETPSVSTGVTDNGTMWALTCPAASTPSPCFQWSSKSKGLLKAEEIDSYGCAVAGPRLTCPAGSFSALQPFTCTASNGITELKYQFPSIDPALIMAKDVTKTQNSVDGNTVNATVGNCSCDIPTTTTSSSDITESAESTPNDTTPVTSPVDTTSANGTSSTQTTTVPDVHFRLLQPKRPEDSSDVPSATGNAGSDQKSGSPFQSEPVAQNVHKGPESLASRHLSEVISVSVVWSLVFVDIF